MNPQDPRKILIRGSSERIAEGVIWSGFPFGFGFGVFVSRLVKVQRHFALWSSLIRYTLPLLGYLKYATDVRASFQNGSAEQNVGSEDTGLVLAAGATTRL